MHDNLVCFVCDDHLAAFDFWGLDVYIKPVHGLFQAAISLRIGQKVFFGID
jgi:hypothetical protein